MPNLSTDLTAGNVTIGGTLTVGAITSSGAISGTTITGSSTVQGTRMIATSAGAATSGSESFEVLGRGGLYSSGAGALVTAAGGAAGITQTAGLASVNGTISASAEVLSGLLRFTPQTAFAAVTTVLAYAGVFQRVTLTGGAVVNGATPSISGGTAGDLLILEGITGAGSYAIQDYRTLASSGLTLMTTSVVLGLDDFVILLCTAASTWKQISPVANNI